MLCSNRLVYAHRRIRIRAHPTTKHMVQHKLHHLTVVVRAGSSISLCALTAL